MGIISKIFKKFEGMSFDDVKEAVKMTAEEHPETAAKIAWGAGVTVFVVCEWMAIHRLNNMVAKIRFDVDNLIEANNINAERINALGIMNANNLHADGAMIDVIADKLGIADDISAAGLKASDSYLESIGTNVEEAVNYINTHNVIATVNDSAASSYPTCSIRKTLF